MAVTVVAAPVFAGVVGHAEVARLLTAEVGAPAGAYLFTGPAAAGKATMARRFAAALLCGEGGSVADPGCIRRVLEGNHPDLIVVEPEGTASITVDQARRVVALASRAPMVADRKVFLFEEGGAMTDEAANALLKSLEEPTATTVFVVVTESEDDLPETIASRCRTVVFGRVPDDEIVAGLVAAGVSAEQAEKAARISGGRPGLALALATRPEVATFRHTWLSVPMRLSAQPGDAFLLADEVVAATEPLLAALKESHAEAVSAAMEGTDLKALKDRQTRQLKRATAALHVTGLEMLAGFYRDAAAAQYGAPVRNPDIPATALTSVRPAEAVAHATRVLEAIEALEANQRPVLAFADLFADLGADA